MSLAVNPLWHLGHSVEQKRFSFQLLAISISSSMLKYLRKASFWKTWFIANLHNKVGLTIMVVM
jgi:hypothetical protein